MPWSNGVGPGQLMDWASLTTRTRPYVGLTCDFRGAAVSGEWISGNQQGGRHEESGRWNVGRMDGRCGQQAPQSCALRVGC